MSEDFSFGKTLSNSYNLSTAIVAPQGDIPESVAQKQYVDDKDAVLQQQITSTQADLNGFPDQLKFMDTAEIQQLENIGTTTISGSQWGHVGGLDQDLATTDDVTFANVATNSIEMKSGTLDEDVIFQTTDAENRLRINKQGDFRYYNDSSIRTIGMDETVISMYDVNGDLSSNMYSNRPGNTNDYVLETKSPDGTYFPYNLRRDGSTNTKNTSDNVTLNTSSGGIFISDTDGDLTTALYGNTAGTDNTTLVQISNKAQTVVTYDINRNGTVIQRDIAGTQKFTSDTATGIFTVDNTVNTGTLIAGTNSEINANGLSIKSSTSGGNSLLSVLSASAVFRDDTGTQRAEINDGGVLIPLDKDFLIDGVTSLKTVRNSTITNAGNISTNTSNISTNTTNIGTNTTNISNNTSAIANKADGNVSGSYSRIGSASGQSEGISISSGTVAPTSGTGKNILLRGGDILEFGCSGIANVCAGQWAAGAANVATDNVVLGYGHIFSASMSNSVVIGNDNTMTSGNQRCIVIGDELTNSGNDNVIIGQNSDSNASESICCGNNNSDTSGGSDNTLFGFSTTITAGSNNVVVGNQSTVSNGGVNVGFGSIVRGNSAGLGSNNIIGSIVPIDQTIALGNSITSNVADAFVIGNNITNTNPGIILKSAFETAASGSTAVFESLAGGIVKIGSVVSSRRYKKDIKDISETFKTSDIYKLNPKSFVYKDKETEEVGVIAEDYVGCGSKLLESLVIWGDEKEDEEVDESEPRNDKGEVVKSYKYNSLIVPMIAEMKKLKEQNDKLTKQVNSLSALVKEHIKKCSV